MSSFNGKRAKRACTVNAVFMRLIEEFQFLSSANEHIPRYKEFLETLMKGLELLKMWEGTSCFNFFHFLRYGFQIHQLKREIESFHKDYSRFQFSDVVEHLLAKLEKHRQQYELGLMDDSKMKETIFQHVSNFTNDPQQNAMILQQMCADITFDDALVKVPCDVLDEEARECFSDLALFPERRKICVDALLDIWVYVRKIEWWGAFVILLELASRNLLNLTGHPGNQAINSFEVYLRQHDGKLESSKMFFSHHDVMMASASRARLVCRMFMPRKKESLPEDRERSKDQEFDARIVSIHTGTMEEDQWRIGPGIVTNAGTMEENQRCKMNFCEAEALVLLASATNYSLPSFLSKMRKLKVLIVFNYGSERATVKVNRLSLAQLKTLRIWVSPI